MKHLDVRRCCLQDELKSGNYTVNSVDRKFNASDMLTHSPSADELRRFIPMLGCHTVTVKKQDFSAVNTMLTQVPAAKHTAFLTNTGCFIG